MGWSLPKAKIRVFQSLRLNFRVNGENIEK